MFGVMFGVQQPPPSILPHHLFGIGRILNPVQRRVKSK